MDTDLMAQARLTFGLYSKTLDLPVLPLID